MGDKKLGVIKTRKGNISGTGFGQRAERHTPSLSYLLVGPIYCLAFNVI